MDISFDSSASYNRKLLSEAKDIKLLKSLVGSKCLVKRNSHQRNYIPIEILGYEDGIVKFCEEDAVGSPEYQHRHDFYPIIREMPTFFSSEDEGNEHEV